MTANLNAASVCRRTLFPVPNCGKSPRRQRLLVRPAQNRRRDKLVGYLSRFGFCILTGLPAYGYDKAEKEKRLWLKKHYNKEDGVICCLSKDKQNFGARQDILIDDLPANIARWEQMGGIGILHTSADETIRKLQELGYK